MMTTRHPKGLLTLFSTEMWERFSFYGMRAILVYYMTAAVTDGGLGFDAKTAATIYGNYLMAVYFTSLPGGWIADRWLGKWNAVLLGGLLIAAGQFTLLFHSVSSMYASLILIAMGTGFLKPNVSAMVGDLYGQNDSRRDSGFSIFYMGINIGAAMAPLVCGYFAQSQIFRDWLVSMGFDATAGWHWGFGAAGIGMIIGLLAFTIAGRHMRKAATHRDEKKEAGKDKASTPLTKEERSRIVVIVVLFVFAMFFWAAYEQKGASLNLFARDLVDTTFLGWQFPSSWLQSMTAIFVICLAPIFSVLWVRLGDRQPASPTKFTLGLLAIGVGYLLMIPASLLTAAGKVSPLWLVGLYFLEVVGEMCLSPVGLSTVTKLSPARFVGIMMGVWFLAASFGGKLAGVLSTLYDGSSPQNLAILYGSVAVALLLSSALLFTFTPRIKRMMGNVL